MENTKRTIELLANNTAEAKELKEALSKKGFKVNHIYSGSFTPIVIENGHYYSGLGNIRVMYELHN